MFSLLRNPVKKINMKIHVVSENTCTAETEIDVPTLSRNQYFSKNAQHPYNNLKINQAAVVSLRSIQLLRSHLGDGEGESVKMQTYANRRRNGGGIMPMRTFASKFLKGLFRPSKRKRNTEMGMNCS